MILEQEVRGDVGVLSVTGEFDTLDVEKFAAAVAALLAAGTVRAALSLEKLTFINSTALGSLIREHERLTQAGGDLACAALSPFTLKNFRLLGMDRRIRCFPTLEEAVAYLRGVGKGGVAPGGAQRVGFRFASEGEKGRERLAELLEMREDGLSLRLDNVEGLDPAAAFPPGRELILRFGLELAHPTHEFRVRGRVRTADSGAGRKVAVHVAFDRMPRTEEEAIARFVKDLRYIRSETGSGGGD